MAEILDVEYRTYEENREELLTKAENQFVLIHSREIKGAYESEKDAINAGYDVFGNVAFLVKKVLRIEEPPVYVSSYFAF